MEWSILEEGLAGCLESETEVLSLGNEGNSAAFCFSSHLQGIYFYGLTLDSYYIYY